MKATRPEHTWWALVAGLALTTTCRGQYFDTLGPGISYSWVYDVLSDSTNDMLYVGSDAQGSNDQSIASPGVLRWDDSGYSPVGCGFDSNCIPAANWNAVAPVRGLEFWDGELYACGEMALPVFGGAIVNYIGRFDGTTWQQLGSGMDRQVRSIHAYPDGLYAAGWFDHADTVVAHGLARWDGSQWHSVFDLPDITPLSATNEINDMAIYKGEVYIGGQFRGAGDMQCLARYHNGQWEPVGQGLRGTYVQVIHMAVHDSLLYIAGAFADQGQYGDPSNPASGIVAWNGNDWVELGSGTDGADVPWVIDMAWRRDTLYACGDFNMIGGVPAGKLAYWDGHHWCGMLPADPPYYVDGGVTTLGFYRDTLIVAGNYVEINGVPFARIAKWIGGDHVEGCGVDGIEEGNEPGDPLIIYPAPTGELLQWKGGPGRGSFTIIDMLARVVRSGPVSAAHALNVETLAAGSYVLQLASDAMNTRRWSSRFLKR